MQRRNLFQDSNFPKSYLTQIRGFSWHNNEIKRIRSGYYSSNNFQDSNKIKDEAEARRLQRRAQAYTIINSELYKRSVSGIF
jgi:hypothetical protein